MIHFNLQELERNDYHELLSMSYEQSRDKYNQLYFLLKKGGEKYKAVSSDDEDFIEPHRWNTYAPEHRVRLLRGMYHRLLTISYWTEYESLCHEVDVLNETCGYEKKPHIRQHNFITADHDLQRKRINERKALIIKLNEIVEYTSRGQYYPSFKHYRGMLRTIRKTVQKKCINAPVPIPDISQEQWRKMPLTDREHLIKQTLEYLNTILKL